MWVNPSYRVEIVPLMPQGTNSTLFTECCGVAISDDERCCPRCKREVIGANIEIIEERGKIRWENATRFWERK